MANKEDGNGFLPIKKSPGSRRKAKFKLSGTNNDLLVSKAEISLISKFVSRACIGSEKGRTFLSDPRRSRKLYLSRLCVSADLKAENVTCALEKDLVLPIRPRAFRIYLLLCIMAELADKRGDETRDLFERANEHQFRDKGL